MDHSGHLYSYKGTWRPYAAGRSWSGMRQSMFCEEFASRQALSWYSVHMNGPQSNQMVEKCTRRLKSSPSGITISSVPPELIAKFDAVRTALWFLRSPKNYIL